MEKALQTEEKLHVIQNAQSESLRTEFQKSGDDFRELLKMDLALLRNDERLLWEKERQAIREEEVRTHILNDAFQKRRCSTSFYRRVKNAQSTELKIVESLSMYHFLCNLVSKIWHMRWD
jgi:hypothetical protein